MTFALITTSPLQILKRYDGVIPEPIVWPNGDATHGISAGHSYKEWQFVELRHDTAPDEFYDAETGSETYRLDSPFLRVTRRWTARALAPVQVALVNRVNEAAEALRLTHVTAGSGQAMVYMQKHAEALRCLGDDKPTPEKYPLIAATVGIEAATLVDVANAVALSNAQWVGIAAQIERTRFAAKAEIETAGSVTDAVAAYRAVVW